MVRRRRRRRRWKKKKRIKQFVRREQRIDIVGCVIEIGVNTGEHKYIIVYDNPFERTKRRVTKLSIIKH